MEVTVWLMHKLLESHVPSMFRFPHPARCPHTFGHVVDVFLGLMSSWSRYFLADVPDLQPEQGVCSCQLNQRRSQVGFPTKTCRFLSHDPTRRSVSALSCRFTASAGADTDPVCELEIPRLNPLWIFPVTGGLLPCIPGPDDPYMDRLSDQLTQECAAELVQLVSTQSQRDMCRPVLVRFLRGLSSFLGTSSDLVALLQIVSLTLQLKTFWDKTISLLFSPI